MESELVEIRKIRKLMFKDGSQENARCIRPITYSISDYQLYVLCDNLDPLLFPRTLFIVSFIYPVMCLNCPPHQSVLLTLSCQYMDICYLELIQLLIWHFRFFYASMKRLTIKS